MELPLVNSQGGGRTADTATRADGPKISCYTVDISICSQICRLAVTEHGLPFEGVNVDIEQKLEQFEPWYIRINPNMTVPAMSYNGEVIADSKLILHHLARCHPERGLYPEGLRSAIDEFIEKFYGKFALIGGFTFQNLMTWSLAHKLFIIWTKGIQSGSKLKQLLKDPEFAQLAQAKLDKKAAQKEEAFQPLPQITAPFQQILDEMEQDLAKSGSNDAFVIGSQYTLADVVATCLCARIHMIKGESMFGPFTKKYWHRMQERRSFREAKVIGVFEESVMHGQILEFKKGCQIKCCVLALVIMALCVIAFWAIG